MVVLCIQKAFAVARLVKILHQLRLGDFLRLRGGFAVGDAAVARFIGDSVQKRCAVVGDRFPRMNGGVDEAVAVRALIDRDFQHRPPRITVVIIHGDGVFPVFVAVALGHGDVPCNGIFPFLVTVGGAHERFFQQAALVLSRNVVIGAAREADDGSV